MRLKCCGLITYATNNVLLGDLYNFELHKSRLCIYNDSPKPPNIKENITGAVLWQMTQAHTADIPEKKM